MDSHAIPRFKVAAASAHGAQQPDGLERKLNVTAVFFSTVLLSTALFTAASFTAVDRNGHGDGWSG